MLILNRNPVLCLAIEVPIQSKFNTEGSAATLIEAKA
jgi:hypothetical protein